jgi:hypothetical protein
LRGLIEEIQVSHSGEYWLKNRGAPFATFLVVVQAHLHSEADPDNFSALKRRAQGDRADDAELQTFRQEFSRLLRGDRVGLPSGAISLAPDREGRDTDDKFLGWLWQQLCPDKPVPPKAGGWSSSSERLNMTEIELGWEFKLRFAQKLRHVQTLVSRTRTDVVWGRP